MMQLSRIRLIRATNTILILTVRLPMDFAAADVLKETEIQATTFGYRDGEG